MEFKDVILKRKSTRNFCKKEVSQDNINTIINAGRLAPSAKNRQPWLYVQVSNEEKEIIANELLKYSMENEDEATSNQTSKVINECNKFILVFLNTNDATNNTDADLLSLGASIENCCLQATDLNIDSLWIRDIVAIESFVKDLLKIKYSLESGICLGYRSKELSPIKKNIKDIFIINE